MDLVEIRKLIQLVKRTGIGELEVSEGGRTVRITANTHGPAHAAPMPAAVPAAPTPAPAAVAHPAATSPAANAPIPAAAPEQRYVKVISPMVGTFYRAPAPDADSYVEVGDSVDVGQTVCIIEAMKLMNEIEAEVRGRVAQISVENGQPVEYGQTLFLIDPQG
ncbi:MAG TPA: acetyl-CoA carboxylase biotin carboxyl carrier protein [Candidatus Eisenbacteria bacterium]|nr:acetyl-CoA carboxylase biotin carboxyl carrier protein [Candidatus Eisenbacteria bacterium]